MATLIMYYDSKCKHCKHCVTKKNAKNRSQAYCQVKQVFIRLKDKACKELKL